MPLVPKHLLARRQVRVLLALLSVAIVAALVVAPAGSVWRLGLGLAAALLSVLAWVRSRSSPAAVTAPRTSARPGKERPSFLATGLYDPLTRLPNRALLNELLDKQVAQAQRSGHFLGVVVCDLDRFKLFNDSLGQSGGDQILRQVANRFQGRIRQADTLSRTGGDAFTLVVPRAERPDDVVLAARRMLATLEEPFAIGDKRMLVSASAGLSVFPQDAIEGAALVGNAEEALARAKELGGNSLQVFAPSMNRRNVERTALGQELREAIEGRDLCVHYQPQVALDDGRLVGLEGLVRWPHPERGLLAAGAFISLAEEGGMMTALGGWLIEEICRQNTDWLRRGLARIPVSVNASIRQFQSGDVAAVVSRALQKTGLEPELLHLEITESISMLESEPIGETLARLQELGVKIHLDDFGTGYSSLSYLLRYPTDFLKIDRSFIDGVPEREESSKIVRLTIALASELGLGLIAEGVETREQLDFLRAEGCPVAQGYLLGRPMPVAECETLLRRGRIELSETATPAS